MKRSIGFLCTLALAFSLIVPATVAAADAAGSGPGSASAISGTMSGRLDSPQTYWYQVRGDGTNPIAITLDFATPDGANPPGVFFNVDWATPQGTPNADWPGLYRTDRSSLYRTPGVRYWSQSPSAATTYYIEVVNNGGEPMSYALASTGATLPPPTLSLGAPSTAPVGPPVAPPPAATPPPSSGPGPLANTATDRSGLIDDPRISVSGPFSTIDVRVDSASSNEIRIDRIVVMPPAGAVVDAVVPSQTAEEPGIVWYTDALVNQANPLVGYVVRFWGTADGAVVEIDWSTAHDKGVLSVTISGAPQPAPPGAATQ